ncbi:hypothetical protein CI610_02750 [invertebrate metagenome]|uniref:Uncharacterized protein n=1 Tax=invertebrate metagenome TaxID=1711999 RepID=A0A2H9T524_9ZZZZ
MRGKKLTSGPKTRSGDCGHVILDGDDHDTCSTCRGCSRDNMCSVCLTWSNTLWDRVLSHQSVSRNKGAKSGADSKRQPKVQCGAVVSLPPGSEAFLPPEGEVILSHGGRHSLATEEPIHTHISEAVGPLGSIGHQKGTHPGISLEVEGSECPGTISVSGMVTEQASHATRAPLRGAGVPTDSRPAGTASFYGGSGEAALGAGSVSVSLPGVGLPYFESGLGSGVMHPSVPRSALPLSGPPPVRAPGSVGFMGAPGHPPPYPYPHSAPGLGGSLQSPGNFGHFQPYWPGRSPVGGNSFPGPAGVGMLPSPQYSGFGQHWGPSQSMGFPYPGYGQTFPGYTGQPWVSSAVYNQSGVELGPPPSRSRLVKSKRVHRPSKTLAETPRSSLPSRVKRKVNFSHLSAGLSSASKCRRMEAPDQTVSRSTSSFGQSPQTDLQETEDMDFEESETEDVGQLTLPDDGDTLSLDAGSDLDAETRSWLPSVPTEGSDHESFHSEADNPDSDLGLAASQAERNLDSFRSLRLEVASLLGVEFCPPPSASSLPERTSTLSAFLPSEPEAKASGRSLAEGTMVSSALAQIEKVLQAKGSSNRKQDLSGLLLGVSDIEGFSPSRYSVHNSSVEPTPAKVDLILDHRWPGRSNDIVHLSPKEHSRMERLLRLAIHVLAYADSFSSALFVASSHSEESLPNKTKLLAELSKAMNRAHMDGTALILAVLADFVLARRAAVLKPRLAVGEPFISDLMTAPLSGSEMFGGILTSVMDRVNNDKAASARLEKLRAKPKPGRVQRPGKPKRGAQTTQSQTQTQPPVASAVRGGHSSRGRGSQSHRGGRGGKKNPSKKGQSS